MFAIGRATAAALADAGYKNVVSPQQSIDSEGLLALPQLQHVEGQHIILVKGQSELGGRALLEHTLAARGARVTVLACYRRASFVPDSAAREALRELLVSRRVHGCFVLSVETLDSLNNIFAGMKLSPQTEIALLVPHVRVAEAARSRGFNKILEVPLVESAMIAALAEMKPQLLTRNPLLS
jgi:uroporphyrinogen-III synthase